MNLKSIFLGIIIGSASTALYLNQPNEEQNVPNTILFKNNERIAKIVDSPNNQDDALILQRRYKEEDGQEHIFDEVAFYGIDIKSEKVVAKANEYLNEGFTSYEY